MHPLIPRKCKVKHDPPRSHGDCIAACVATLTDDDNVPHVFDGRPPEESWVALRKYLMSKNRYVALFPSDEDPRPTMKEINPDLHYMLLCTFGKENHAAIFRGETLVHNPAYYSSPVTGPLKNGSWVVGIIT